MQPARDRGERAVSVRPQPSNAQKTHAQVATRRQYPPLRRGCTDLRVESNSRSPSRRGTREDGAWCRAIGSRASCLSAPRRLSKVRAQSRALATRIRRNRRTDDWHPCSLRFRFTNVAELRRSNAPGIATLQSETAGCDDSARFVTCSILGDAGDGSSHLSGRTAP